VISVEQQYLDGVITNGERYNKVIAIWSEVTDKVAKEMFKAMDDREKSSGELNPILVMSDSGARGSAQQIRQLAGMRGLMARPPAKSLKPQFRRTSAKV
jgi:DNA-directed RNA polymerase subunit beta'